jgi:DNA-binding MarR family transcriptional regulator
MVAADDDGDHAPILDLMSSKLLVVSNLLRRGAALRYQRMFGLTSTEFGILAVLGRRPPVTVNRLAELMGVDKAQASRALTRVVDAGFAMRRPNPRDNREMFVALTDSGLAAHDSMVATGRARNADLLCDFSAAERRLLAAMLERIHQRAAELLDAEQEAPARAGRAGAIAT